MFSKHINAEYDVVLAVSDMLVDSVAMCAEAAPTAGSEKLATRLIEA